MTGGNDGPVPLPPAPRGGWESVRFHGLRWLMLGALAVFTYVLFPVAGGVDAPVLEVGEVAHRDVVAPFEFAVRKSGAELQREGNALAATVRPIYEYDPAVLESVSEQTGQIFAVLEAATDPAELVDGAAGLGLRLSSDEAAFLLTGVTRRAYRTAVDRMLQTELQRGVASNSTIGVETAREIVVRRGQIERVVPRDSILSFAGFLDRRSGALPAPHSSVGDQVYVKLLNVLFRPTLIPSVAETEALRAELRASVDSVRDVVRANERIVAAHEVVSAEARDRLLALRAELIRRGEAEGMSFPVAVGQVLSNGLVLAIFWTLLLFYRRESYRNLRQMLLVTTLFALVIGGAAINSRFIIPGSPELIPIPFAAMLFTVLFSGRIGIMAAVVLAMLLGTQPVYGGGTALYLCLIGGVAAAISVRVVHRRSQIIATAAVVAGAFVVAAVTAGLKAGWPLNDVMASMILGSVNAVGSSALVIFTLPIFEAFGRVTTALTLLELSDPSRPLLRRLATEAPGTYAHSVAMANLCEAACNAIGANGLLARVGCYYHDVGKLAKPQYFVENQGLGGNPHDRLEPEVSAAIIRNHVKEGLALAAEHRLPEAVAAFIPEHHGTAEITYFLDRARKSGSIDKVPPEAYQYPGPKPRSVETAVAMLADGVEAALRVLEEPTPEHLRDAIDHIVTQRVQSGQLSDAPLTLAQLDRVKEEFLRVLSSMSHARIDYPASSGGISAEWAPVSRS